MYILYICSPSVKQLQNLTWHSICQYILNTRKKLQQSFQPQIAVFQKTTWNLIEAW